MRAILIGLILTLIALPAAAQTQQERRDWCFAASATDDQTIEGCGIILQSSNEDTASRAAAFDDRAFAYNHKGLDDLAIADENQAIMLKPNSANEYINRGNAYDGKGLYDLAIADFTASMARNADTEAAYNNAGNAFAYNHRGIAYMHKGAYDSALADFNQAIALKSDFAKAYENRADAYDKKGMRQAAINDYRAALNITPDLSSARDALTRLGVAP